MKLRLYYIGFYATNDNVQNRQIYLSAVNKMDYVLQTLQSIGLDITVVSCSKSNNSKVYFGSKQVIADKTYLKQFMTLGRRSLLFRVIDRPLIKLQLFIYLLSNVKNNDVMIVYHSLFYVKILRFVKWIKRCKLILELEEVYSDVTERQKDRKKEYIIFNSSDGYLLSTQLLVDFLNIKNKPVIVSHGSYMVERDRFLKKIDNNIHVVYAGTLDPRKGGALAAAAAVYLPSNYHIHILGFGTKNEKDQLQEIIKQCRLTGHAEITYDGVLSGDEYVCFMQSNDIGLSTQNPNATFNSSSFPSKIISYMANGLQVVSIRIPAIENSKIGDIIYYYEEQSPESIAKAILSVNLLERIDTRQKVKELDIQFVKEFRVMLDKLIIKSEKIN